MASSYQWRYTLFVKGGVDTLEKGLSGGRIWCISDSNLDLGGHILGTMLSGISSRLQRDSLWRFRSDHRFFNRFRQVNNHEKIIWK
jgi:hypothetical protein